MEITEWYLKGFVTITPNSLFFRGSRYDVHGTKEMEYGYKLNSTVKFSFRQKTRQGILIKINKTTAVIKESSGEEVKVSIQNIIINNRYPTFIYRFQDKIDKKGPFHTSTKYPQDVKYVLFENLNRISSNPHRFKPPQLDSDLENDFNRDFKFACASKMDIDTWFIELTFLSDYFETITLQEGWDYIESYYGDSQVIYKELVD